VVKAMKHSILFVLAAPLLAQAPLSLREAVEVALRENRSIAETEAAVAASSSRIAQARGGLFPKVNYSESYTRGNNPVYVFGSLLTQHQFGVENFNVGILNRPDALNNFQSQLTVDQVIYDAGQTGAGIRSATAGREMSAEERRRAGMRVIAGVARAYYATVLAAESVSAAEHALGSAEADLKRAQHVRAAGMSTDIDVLSIRVHLAAANEQRIQRRADLEVAKAALNDAMGLPLDTAHSLTTALRPMDLPDLALEALEHQASESRPEARQTHLAAELAKTQSDAARGALRPQVSLHAAFEADRQRFVDRGGANWLVSVGLRWNLFNGLADKARVEESRYGVDRAHAKEQWVDSAVRLEVRRAWAGLQAAQQRIEVAGAAVSEAEESLRITQNRYESGMSNVTDLLRNETAALQSRTRYLEAVHDQRVAATMLELAAGGLTAASEVLNK
jgi:outer membrane protein